jgi:peptidoglycan/xylan/chitin deacetylase (PgdA/CDA1 family)
MAKRSWRRLRARHSGGVAILGYHRVHTGGPDPLQLSVSPAAFEEHLAVLVRTTRPMRLAAVRDALASAAVPGRAVVLTFDDGYADNLYVALPLLERFDVPATVLVTSAARGEEFWWDRLARLAGRGATGGHPAHRAVAELAQTFETLDAADREVALAELEAADDAPEPTQRSLTWEELERLARHPLIEIGSHTVSHTALAALPEDEQFHELTHSKQTLEACLGGDVTSFAYPHGSFSPRTLALARNAGYALACASDEDLASHRSEPMALPRLWAADTDGDRFARWLNGWLGS